MTTHASGARSGAAVRIPAKTGIGSGWVVFAAAGHT